MVKALVIENLSVQYPNQPDYALEAISFSVEQGSITALLGPNGSGKTTLLKAILGLVPYKGIISVFGQPVHKVSERIGYVPQRFSFDTTFPISVEEFLEVVMFHDSTQEFEKRINTVLSEVGASQLRTQLLSSLSGGQLQRILLARALIREPDLLILDEPEAGVDVGGEQIFYDLLEKLVNKRKMTVIISSHELDVVYTYADQVVCLNRKLLCTGAPKKVLDQKTFMQLYGRGLRFYGHDHH